MKQIVTKLKKKTANGFTDPLPLGASAQNVILSDGTMLQDILTKLQNKIVTTATEITFPLDFDIKANDYVTYEGDLYRAYVDIPTGQESFESNNFEKIILMEEVQRLLKKEKEYQNQQIYGDFKILGENGLILEPVLSNSYYPTQWNLSGTVMIKGKIYNIDFPTFVANDFPPPSPDPQRIDYFYLKYDQDNPQEIGYYIDTGISFSTEEEYNLRPHVYNHKRSVYPLGGNIYIYPIYKIKWNWSIGAASSVANWYPLYPKKGEQIQVLYETLNSNSMTTLIKENKIDCDIIKPNTLYQIETGFNLNNYNTPLIFDCIIYNNDSSQIFFKQTNKTEYNNSGTNIIYKVFYLKSSDYENEKIFIKLSIDNNTGVSLSGNYYINLIKVD